MHDVRKKILLKCKERLKRNKISNYEIFQPDSSNKLKRNYYDVILLDVPCSGTGTIRRNPDFKNNFSKDELQKVIDVQKDIFDKAVKYLKPDGILI